MFKICVLLITISFVAAFSAIDSYAQKSGKGRYRKVSLNKDARKNGYKITVEAAVNYFEAVEVEDPLTKKLLETLKKLEYRCRQDEPLTTISLTFSRGNSRRVRVPCVILIQPKIIIKEDD
jgi:hypothetical protein